MHYCPADDILGRGSPETVHWVVQQTYIAPVCMCEAIICSKTVGVITHKAMNVGP